MERLYKNKYISCFYEKDDDTYVCGFDNTQEILKDKGLEVQQVNIPKVSKRKRIIDYDIQEEI